MSKRYKNIILSITILFFILLFSGCPTTGSKKPSDKTVLEESPALTSEMTEIPTPVSTKTPVLDKSLEPTEEKTAAPDTDGLYIIMIPPGSKATFNMGSDTEGPYMKPIHSVTLTRPFSISKHEVTLKQAADVYNWALSRGYVTTTTAAVKNTSGDAQKLLSLDGSYSQISYLEEKLVVRSGKDNYPCTDISWYGAAAYCNFLSEMEGMETVYDFTDWACDFTKKGYRLPTEAEWEYSARGGQLSRGYIYSGSNNPDEVGWYVDNSINPDNPLEGEKGSFAVGLKKPNEAGIYDMSGNVLEWCWDWYEYGYLSSLAQDPGGPDSSSHRIIRGGYWFGGAFRCTVTYRFGGYPDRSYGSIGFRPVRLEE